MLSLLKAANAADASLLGVLPIDLGLGVFVLMTTRVRRSRPQTRLGHGLLGTRRLQPKFGPAP